MAVAVPLCLASIATTALLGACLVPSSLAVLVVSVTGMVFLLSLRVSGVCAPLLEGAVGIPGFSNTLEVSRGSLS